MGAARATRESPTHQVTRQTGRQRPMKPSKFEGGGFYCTVKEPDGSYCKAKA
jgi:hypothetical protein